MKNHLPKLIAMILASVLMLIALTSCWGDVLGRGWGFPNDGQPYDYYWFETYDECVEAIKLLKSHGSTFLGNRMLTSYEGDLFDMKYCIKIREDSVKSKGGQAFAWEVENVSILCYAFFKKDVKIDDITYSVCVESDFNAYSIFPSIEYASNHDFNYENLTPDLLEYRTFEEGKNQCYEYRLKEDNTKALTIYTSTYVHNYNGAITDECVQAIIDSIDIDMYKYMYGLN